MPLIPVPANIEGEKKSIEPRITLHRTINQLIEQFTSLQQNESGIVHGINLDIAHMGCIQAS